MSEIPEMLNVQLCFPTPDFPASFYEMTATREITDLSGDARDCMPVSANGQC